MRLFWHLRRYRVLIAFMLLELSAVLLFSRGESSRGSPLWKTARESTAVMQLASFELWRYLRLRTINTALVAENLRLRNSLPKEGSKAFTTWASDSRTLYDSSLRLTHLFATVIGNSYDKRHNVLTLNAGYQDGLRVGMGLLGPDGIAGRIRHVSTHFATAYSLLDVDLLTSARLGRGGVLCSMRWDGVGTRYAVVDYLPRYLTPKPGDTLYTSGFENSYPAGLPIGAIEHVFLEEDASFYSVRLRLFTNFQTLNHVYVLRLPARQERDSLETHMRAQQH